MQSIGLFRMYGDSEGEKVKYPFVRVKMSLVKEAITEKVVLTKSEDAYQYARNYFRELDREHLIVIYLDSYRVVIGVEVLSIGDLTSTIASPREVFKGALLANAYSIILVHNHPFGGLEPSDEDITFAKNIRKAGNLLSIPVEDVMIVTDEGYHNVD